MLPNDDTNESGHIPVLGDEVLAVFKGDYQVSLPKVNKYKIQFEEKVFSPKTYFDGTFGRGGHLRLMFSEFPGLQATALDKDMTAVKYAQSKFSTEIAQKRLQIVANDFSTFSDLRGRGKIPKYYDLMLLDLGVSSPQLDVPERGFSFYSDGPLDMRMNQGQDLNAAVIVNSYSEEKLWHIFRDLGEIRSPGKVIRKIIERRQQKEISTTSELSSLIEKTDGWRKKGHHPATLYFMALRMEVNGELEAIRQAIPGMIESLNEGGRLAIISFHSLEDRLVKSLFKSHQDQGRLVNRKVIAPSVHELERNVRSRSAKLRAFQKGFAQEVTV